MLVISILNRHIYIETDTGTCTNICVNTGIDTQREKRKHRRLKTHACTRTDIDTQKERNANTDA